MSNESMQAVYDAAKKFLEDAQNLDVLKAAIAAHDETPAETPTPEPAPPEQPAP
jgi:hypothetical protein